MYGALSPVLVIAQGQSASLRWGRSSVGRALNRHAVDTGSIPWRGKGFFSQSQHSVHTFLQCPYASVCSRMLLTSVRALEIM